MMRKSGYYLGKQNARRSEVVYTSSTCWLGSRSRSMSFHFYFYSNKLSHRLQCLLLEPSYCFPASFCFSWFKVLFGGRICEVDQKAYYTSDRNNIAENMKWSPVIFLRPKWALDVGVTILPALFQLVSSCLPGSEICHVILKSWTRSIFCP